MHPQAEQESIFEEIWEIWMLKVVILVLACVLRTTTKKIVNFWGEESALPEKILSTAMARGISCWPPINTWREVATTRRQSIAARWLMKTDSVRCIVEMSDYEYCRALLSRCSILATGSRKYAWQATWKEVGQQKDSRRNNYLDNVHRRSQDFLRGYTFLREKKLVPFGPFFNSRS